MDDDRFRQAEEQGRREMHAFWCGFWERSAMRREELARRYGSAPVMMSAPETAQAGPETEPAERSER